MILTIQREQWFKSLISPTTSDIKTRRTKTILLVWSTPSFPMSFGTLWTQFRVKSFERSNFCKQSSSVSRTKKMISTWFSQSWTSLSRRFRRVKKLSRTQHISCSLQFKTCLTQPSWKQVNSRKTIRNLTCLWWCKRSSTCKSLKPTIKVSSSISKTLLTMTPSS